MSPTQRSLKKLRAEGYYCAVTEHFNPWVKIRQDLFGFIDILALRDNETLAIQTTSGSNVAARIDKIRALASATLWLSSPARQLHIHGWRKVGPRGKAKKWECRVERL